MWVLVRLLDAGSGHGSMVEAASFRQVGLRRQMKLEARSSKLEALSTDDERHNWWLVEAVVAQH